jgi:hypothetical protein
MSFSTKGKHHSKTVDKIRIACRLEMLNLGLKDKDIATHIGMSQTSYSLLKKTKIYQQLHTQFLTGVLSVADADIVDNLPLQRRILSHAVPSALENLVALATQRIDKKMQFEASKEILDRHGSFAKVSRIGLPTLEQGVGSERDQEVASELISALAKTKKKNDEVEIEATPITIESPSVTETTQ